VFLPELVRDDVLVSFYYHSPLPHFLGLCPWVRHFLLHLKLVVREEVELLEFEQEQRRTVLRKSIVPLRYMIGSLL
jgi:hypothetical protein